jgi:pimeloyl-ACP methyl ester carboxylesterase
MPDEAIAGLRRRVAAARWPSKELVADRSQGVQLPTLQELARYWAELMRRLGYTRYVAQGGDQGAAVTDAMGRQAPEGLIGIHMNLLVTALGGGAMPADTEQERAALEQTKTFRTTGFGYFLEQAARRPHPGPHPPQHHGVLADRHRGLGGPVVLGKRTSPGSCGRPGSC